MRTCSKCDRTNRDQAGFCGYCGQPLTHKAADRVPEKQHGAERHRDPLCSPAGYEQVANAVDFYAQWRTVSQSTLLGPEGLAVTLFNGGRTWNEVVFRFVGEDDKGRRIFELERKLATFPRGDLVKVELPIYEIPAVPSKVRISFVKGRVDRDH